MKHWTARVLLVVAAIAIVSCMQRTRTEHSRQVDEMPPPGGDVLCTENLVAGLIVEVRDASTGEPAAYGARGEIQDGTYVEVLGVEGGGSDDLTMALRLIGAWERPGIYSVVVRKEGYRDWSTTTVVEADTCHVHTVTLQAMLQGQV